MAVRALDKAFREGRNSAFRLHTSFLPCAVNALHQLPERTLWYLFAKKLLTGHTHFFLALVL